MKFSELDLHKSLQDNLAKIQFVECTPIQEEAIPHLLAGRDIAGLAQTGTGKTGAFLIPLVDRVLKSIEAAGATAEPVETPPTEAPKADESEPVEPSGEKPPLRFFPNWQRRNYVLVLVPTRELAEQVYENAQLLLYGTDLKAVAVYGGTTYEKQKAAFRDGVEFVIATPGRLIDLYKENLADLRQVRAVIFDEADRMFDMGFKDDMKFVLRRIPRERQFLVFSATLNFEVLNTAYEFGAFPVEINISKDQPKAENVDDEIFHIGQEEKPKYLLSLIKKASPHQTIVFSNFKRNVERITQFLNDNGLPAVAISSLLTQAQRNRVMAQFKSENNQNILVATDLAARGLDILGVDLVVNYELPEDPENYVHRIGRTGRAGQKGRALSLVSDRDVDSLGRIEEYVGHKITIGWMDEGELVKDFKPLPYERFEREGRPPFRRGEQRPPRGGEGRRRDSGPRHGGGGRPQRRDDFRRDGGRSDGGRSEHRQSRPDHGSGRPERQGRPHGDRHRSDQNRSDQNRSDQHRSDQHRSDQHRSDQRRTDQRRGGEHRGDHRGGDQQRGGDQHRDQRRHADRSRGEHPRGQGSRGDSNRHRHRHRNPHRGGGSMNRGGARAPMSAKSANSLGQKVSGFFKKLFGKESQ